MNQNLKLLVVEFAKLCSHYFRKQNKRTSVTSAHYLPFLEFTSSNQIKYFLSVLLDILPSTFLFTALIRCDAEILRLVSFFNFIIWMKLVPFIMNSIRLIIVGQINLNKQKFLIVHVNPHWTGFRLYFVWSPQTSTECVFCTSLIRICTSVAIFKWSGAIMTFKFYNQFFALILKTKYFWSPVLSKADFFLCHDGRNQCFYSLRF